MAQRHRKNCPPLAYGSYDGTPATRMGLAIRPYRLQNDKTLTMARAGVSCDQVFNVVRY